MNALFAYGTLLFPEVLRAVAGRALPSRVATLPGFARWRLIGEIFPAVVAAAEQDRVSGVLYVGLDSDEWRRLDEFEGELYERRAVTVGVVGAESTSVAPVAGASFAATRPAFTYVLRDGWRHRLAAAPWDPEAFARDHLDAFAARLVRASEPRARPDD
jgi:gamma-glutamylcyclotransferase (GGCT)/AIG2-like uncharacterized protein YtfP